jgi:hypothetical protein
MDNMRCPFCESGIIRRYTDQIAIEPPHIYQDCECVECESSWTDKYLFLERQNLEQPMKFNHQFSIGFSIDSANKPDKVTLSELLIGLRKRVDEINSFDSDEALEAFGLPIDTEELDDPAPTRSPQYEFLDRTCTCGTKDIRRETYADGHQRIVCHNCGTEYEPEVFGEDEPSYANQSPGIVREDMS